MITVNGCELDGEGMSVAELVEGQGYKKERVAVELNEQIVPKAEYEATVLRDGDSVEIVSFVGGG